MRCLYWTESFWPRIGGSEVAAATLIEQLQRRGHQFEVMTRQWSPDQPRTDQWQGVAVHRVAFDDGTLARMDLEEIMPLRQCVAGIKRRFKPDLVHVGLTGPSLFLHNFTAGQFPAPTIATLHVVPVEAEFGRNKPVQETLRTAKWLAPVSQAVARQIQERLPGTADRCWVIYNALPDPQRPLTDVSLSPPKLLCVGRLTEQKGFDTAIAAMPAVRTMFPEAELVIAGDGEAAGSLRELAERLGVSSCVHMPGWVAPEDVPELIDGATIVLMPSRWEPFGLVALQAGQRERVCLASQVDGLTEVVRHERTGLLLPPDQPAKWAQAICSLLGDPRRMATMGREARQFVLRQFGLKQHVDAYESLYRRIVAGERSQEAVA